MEGEADENAGHQDLYDTSSAELFRATTVGMMKISLVIYIYIYILTLC